MKKAVALMSLTIMLFPYAAFAVATLADTPNITTHGINGTTDSFAYTPPAGANQVEIIRVVTGGASTITATQNGVSFTIKTDADCVGVGDETYGTLVAPTTGTFVINFSPSANADYVVYTVNGASQTAPADAASCTHTVGGTTDSGTITPPSANDFLLGWDVTANNINGSSHGGSQVEYIKFNDSTLRDSMYGSYVNGSSTVSTLQGMSEVWSGAGNHDFQILAIAPAPAAAAVSTKRQTIFFQ